MAVGAKRSLASAVR
jgi:hypothetical protein